jgi:hypothetical protein
MRVQRKKGVVGLDKVHLPLGKSWHDPANTFPHACPGKNVIEGRQGVEIRSHGMAVSSGLVAHGGEGPLDLFLGLGLGHCELVVQLHSKEWFDENGLPALAGVLNYSLEGSIILGLGRYDEAAVSQGYELFLDHLGRLTFPDEFFQL